MVIDHDLLFLDGLCTGFMIFEGEPSVSGYAKGPMGKIEGMDMFLKGLGITFRRDRSSGMAHINKYGSVLDRKQKSEGKYYYV